MLTEQNILQMSHGPYPRITYMYLSDDETVRKKGLVLGVVFESPWFQPSVHRAASMIITVFFISKSVKHFGIHEQKLHVLQIFLQVKSPLVIIL